MDKKEWHEKYMNRLMNRGLITEKEAQDTLMAALEDHDYDDDPESAANTEMSYWGSD
ncbi:hypothetical protein LCGC14_2909970 [marine sediment metagenome]|uniref:Uncharacterized protein n=1 Tax=marine sediment metagenome TaxID=412755 RepID=A0A0F9AI15_9ZZZZ